MLSQIVQLVAEAQRTRAPIRLADQVSGYFVPAVIVTALLAFAAWGIWGPEPRFSYGLVAAVAVLIIVPVRARTCDPDVDHGRRRTRSPGRRPHQERRGARAHGKGRHLVVDKTGTLTEGKPAVTAVVTAPGFSESEVLRLAASVERASEHPLAAAIVAAEKQGIATAPVAEFDSRQGRAPSARWRAARSCSATRRS